MKLKRLFTADHLTHAASLCSLGLFALSGVGCQVSLTNEKKLTLASQSAVTIADPKVSIENPASALRGGSVVPIKFAHGAGETAAKSLKLHFAADGAQFSEVAALD